MKEYSKEFQDYLEANKGKGFSDEVRKEAKNELLADEIEYQRSLTSHLDEPDRDTHISRFPGGELFKTEMTREELDRAISELKEARKIIVNLLEKSEVNFLKDPQNITAFKLEDRLAELPEEVGDALGTMARYNVDGSTVLYDLPGELQQLIDKYIILENHLAK